MKQKLLLLFIYLILFQNSFSQELQLSTFAEISILTIGSGETLNDAFGHSAFRIKDPMYKLDIVYNYGVYDFEAPNFYLKFAQGKLDYLIGLDSFEKFYRSYSTVQNRTIIEQKLDLTKEQRQRLFEFLRNNYRPENRRYLYDFFYDNCATKIRDVVNTSTNNTVEFVKPKDLEPKTFRALIYEHVDKNSWGSFGIDLALGSVIDKEVMPKEYMFLPKYIEAFFASAKLASGKPLVRDTNALYSKKNSPPKQNFLASPMFVLNVIGWLIVIITIKDYKSKKRSKWLDAFIFSATGLIGFLILLLWFATDHSATAWNFNLLWAFPLNLIVLWAILKKQPKNWTIKFIKFLLVLLSLMTLHWIIGVQVFAIALIPIMLALALRYLYLIRYYNLITQ